MTTRSGSQPSEHSMAMPDGTELFYRAWLPEQPPQHALVLFHRGHEHSGRFLDVVESLDLDGVAIFAWDARGHGRSPGERGYTPSFATTAHDMDQFVRGLSATHGIPVEDMVVVGHSVGAVGVAAWVHDYAPPLGGVALITPALRVRLYMPFAITGLRLLHRLRRPRHTFIKSYVKSRMLTHDAEQARAYDNDALISRSIAVNVLLDMHDTATRLIQDAGAIHTPILLLRAGADWVVANKVQRDFFDRLGSAVKRIRTFPGGYHDLLHERDCEPILREITDFFRDCTGERPLSPRTRDADRYDGTAAEYDALSQPLSPLSSKGIWFGLQRLLMRTLGQLSEGVRLGWSTGFDSGQSLDYVYANQATGRLGWVGRQVDRQYLSAPGWQGIRERKELIQQQLREAIRTADTDGRPVQVVDLAAGGGRYAIEVAAELGDGAVSLRLRDNVDANVQAARDLARDKGVANVQCEHGDAFDAAAIAALDPAPDIVIVSGLYELIPDNAPVEASLGGIAKALPAGGQLVYTGQPWHPQLEMIARVLPNRNGERWVMRRRTQYELDGLVSAAGLAKRDQTIDAQGIFTVSRAIRRPA